MLRPCLTCVKHLDIGIALALVTMLPSPPQPLVEPPPQPSPLETRPRPSPASGLLSKLVLRFTFCHSIRSSTQATRATEPLMPRTPLSLHNPSPEFSFPPVVVCSISDIARGIDEVLGWLANKRRI